MCLSTKYAKYKESLTSSAFHTAKKWKLIHFPFWQAYRQIRFFFFRTNSNVSVTGQGTSGLVILDLGKLGIACNSSFAPVSKITVFLVIINLF